MILTSRIRLYSQTPLSGTFFGELILRKVPLNGVFVGQTTKRSRYSPFLSSVPKLDLRVSLSLHVVLLLHPKLCKSIWLKNPNQIEKFLVMVIVSFARKGFKLQTQKT